MTGEELERRTVVNLEEALPFVQGVVFNSGQMDIRGATGLARGVIARRGAARMTLTEIEASIHDIARHNLAKNGVATPTEYVVADWTAVPGASHEGKAPWDCLVSNPPFAKSGKRYRRYFIDTLILDAHKLLRSGGALVFVQSSMADIPRSIRLMEEHGMDIRIMGENPVPLLYGFIAALSKHQRRCQVVPVDEVQGVHLHRILY